MAYLICTDLEGTQKEANATMVPVSSEGSQPVPVPKRRSARSKLLSKGVSPTQKNFIVNRDCARKALGEFGMDLGLGKVAEGL
jgi:hypothetical protein